MSWRNEDSYVSWLPGTHGPETSGRELTSEEIKAEEAERKAKYEEYVRQNTFTLMMCGVKFTLTIGDTWNGVSNEMSKGVRYFASSRGPQTSTYSPEWGVYLALAFTTDAIPDECFPHDISREEFDYLRWIKSRDGRLDYFFAWNEGEQCYILVPQCEEAFHAYCQRCREQLSRIRVGNTFSVFPVTDIKEKNGLRATAIAHVNGTRFPVKRSVEVDGTYKYWELDSSRWEASHAK